MVTSDRVSQFLSDMQVLPNATSSEPATGQPAPDMPLPDEFDLLCEHCGYSLVGLTSSNRCPECGEEFDPAALPLARVPWLFRKRLGTLRAYRQTTWAILTRPGSFAKELCRPVRICISDAKAFRRMSVRIAV